MKIVIVEAKDRDRFLAVFRDAGYTVEEGPHTVLHDHSELASYTVKKDGEELAVVVMHYITKYYRAELKNIDDDREYLRELIKIKHSERDWGIPVNPVIVVAFKDEVLNLIENYSDSYPVEDGERLVSAYRSKSPDSISMLQVLLTQILSRLTRSGE